MDDEPLLANQTTPQTESESKPQLQPALPQSRSLPNISSTIEGSQQPQRQPISIPGSLTRCRTAPAIFSWHRLSRNPQVPKPESESISIVWKAILALFGYLVFGVGAYYFFIDKFSVKKTNCVVDALYFCIVTLCTIGYGDIAPSAPLTKVFACVLALLGFVFIYALLVGLVNHVLDAQENLILSGIKRRTRQERFLATTYIVDVEKGRMRIRLKVGLALGAVILAIGVGTLVLHFQEELGWIDSIYLAVMSVTTVGYGDKAFKTTFGRLFAACWLLLSTLAVTKACLYLAERRVHKKQRRITDWALQRDVTVEDWLAADINHNGFISKSEYVIYKLKEMGKIAETDVSQVSKQFSKLDRNNLGKITLFDILENRSNS